MTTSNDNEPPKGIVLPNELSKKEKKNRQLVAKRFKEEILKFNSIIELLDGKIIYAEKYLTLDTPHKCTSMLFMH